VLRPKALLRVTVLVAQLNDVRAQAKGYCVIRSDALTSWNAASGLGARADMGLGRIAVVSAFALSVPCWPALVNGQPFFTLDTIAYLHAAAHGVNRLLGIETVWYAPPVAAAGDVRQALPDTARSTRYRFSSSDGTVGILRPISACQSRA
jgi:hypothetical protein